MDLNITTPVNSLGYGVVGLNLLLSLSRLGHEPALWPIGDVDVEEENVELMRRMLERTGFFNPAAPSLRVSNQGNMAQHIGRGPHCGLPIFELTRFTSVELHHLGAQDLLFVPSGWARDVLVDNGLPAARIRVAPFGVDTGIFGFVDRVAPGPTVFLNVGKWEVRKGHDVLGEAFSKAFSAKDDVRLVLLTPNPFNSAEESDGWEEAFRGSPLGRKVQIIKDRLPSQRDVAALMAGADCGVFPFRGEGWNFGLAEMMAMGKNVIATHYSAPTEYLSADNARLVEVDGLEDAVDAKWFHGQGQWAEYGERQIEQLVEHLREVHRLKQSGALHPNLAARDTMAKLTWDGTARLITAALA
jgi:glycosyltransferase involved in cell wall biosynthesis